jgi:hypothetical protein
MLSVVNTPFVLSVVMLNAIMLSVVVQRRMDVFDEKKFYSIFTFLSNNFLLVTSSSGQCYKAFSP